MSLLKLENISKTYVTGDLKVEALKSVNLEFEQGYFYAIIGKSGSGKSTLLHIMGALDRPTDGKLFLEGESVYEKDDRDIALLRRRRIGFVFQSYNLIPELTALENILLPAHLDGKKPEIDRLKEIISSLDIEDKLPYYPDELSGGERQRVAIARALIVSPAIILADEPTGNLDEKTGKEVIDLIRRLAKRFNQTIILVTHDMDIARQADHIIQIADGEIVFSQVIQIE